MGMTLALYLISDSLLADTDTKSFHYWMVCGAWWLIVIFGLGGVVVDCVMLFGHLFAFFRVFLLIKAIKLIGLVLFVFGMLLTDGGYMKKGSFVLFTATTA